MGGSALLAAAEKFRSAIRVAAANRLGCDAAGVKIGEETVSGPDGRSLKLAELAGISAEGAFLNKKHTYTYGAHAAHVTVDPQTRRRQVIPYTAVPDSRP